MIMCMYKNICITNRSLVKGSLINKLKELLQKSKISIDDKIDIIILREKDLDEEGYRALAKEAIALCENYDVTLMLHSFKNVAKELNYKKIHLTMKQFESLTESEKKSFEIIGVSTHSVEEAIICEKQGASYITASHIFETACKEGLKPRGLEYLEEVTNTVSIQVYALGGINDSNQQLCIEAGASGICKMSSYMK